MRSGAPPLLARSDVLALAGLTALAFALRWWVAPHAPIHENLHGYSVLSGTLVHWEGVRSVYLDLVRWLGLRFEAVFFANAVVSSLAPAAAALVARELTASRTAGLLTGLALALHPLAVRLGGSESELPFAATLFLAGTWSAQVAARRGGVLGWLVAAALLSAAASTHVLTPALVVAAAALVAPGLRGRAWGWAALAFVVPSGVAALRVAALAGQGRGFYLLSGDWASGPVLRVVIDLAALGGLAETRSPLLFQAAALLGLAWTVRQRPAVGAALVVALGALQVPYALVVTDPGGPSAFRHLSLALTVWCLPAGVALAALAERVARHLPPRLGGATPYGAALAASFVLVTGFGFVTEQSTADRAYPVLDACLDELPGWARVVRLRHPTVQHVASLPWVGAKRPRWRPVDPADLAREAAASRDPIVLLIDSQCSMTYAPGHDKPPEVRETPWGPLAEPCASAMLALPWRDVRRVDLPNGPHHGQAWLLPVRATAPVGCLMWPPDRASRD
jgi:hypothetical protein